MFWLALALIIVGSGFLKANISVIVGKLYADGDPRRDSGFSLFYAGINLGAMLASLVVAQTLIPMLAARMSPPPPVAEASLFGRLQRRYTATLDWALGHPKTMAAIAYHTDTCAATLICCEECPNAHHTVRYMRESMCATRPTDQRKVGMRMMAPAAIVNTAMIAAVTAPKVTSGIEPL